jgi:hypothetical protein
MMPLTIAAVAFAFAFAASMAGMQCQRAIPEHHRAGDSKDAAKLVLALIVTLTALVLGLLVTTAKRGYMAQEQEIKQLTANVILLDRILVNYGPAADDARAVLRSAIPLVAERIWHESGSSGAHGHQLLTPEAPAEMLYGSIDALSPKTATEKALKARAFAVVADIGRTRFLLFEQSGSNVAVPFMVIIIVWVSVIFWGFGLLAPRNGTLVALLLICSMSVALAIFLILELDTPFQGLLKLPSAPLLNALAPLAR